MREVSDEKKNRRELAQQRRKMALRKLGNVIEDDVLSVDQGIRCFELIQRCRSLDDIEAVDNFMAYLRRKSVKPKS